MQQVIGRLVAILDVVTGENQRGTWQRGGFVIEVGNDYPSKIAFTTFGDNIGLVNEGMLGRTIQVTYKAESREFGNRWYTDLKALRVGMYSTTPSPSCRGLRNVSPSVAPIAAQAASMAAEQAKAAMPQDDELPFDK